ncbi:MAG: acetyl-CoA carboxylase biotin carboxyl carrier protein [Acidobacteria bacterium]|nr:acetyl-CoA carboxylase biotin carboxyl carrier protein [Acidobacteriota bacterium]
MNIDEIKQLIELVNQTGIAELELERGGNRIRIRRSVAAGTQEIVLHPAPASQAAPAPAAVAAPVSPVTAPDPALALVKSPIVGTFFESPSPGAPPFVKPGDTVQPGQVLCIIESMKLMNEIEAEAAGVIVARLVENAKPVEFGEALFSIRPL